jgi:rhodanese-related sulfurtransferase
MKLMQRTFLMLMGLAILASCQAQGVKPQKLNADGFEAKLNSTKDKILIDVRTPDEYNEGHLNNAVLINFFDDDFKAQIDQLDKSKPVFVYCKAGNRSGKAANALLQAGFKQVFDLDGGITAWADANKKIVK